MGIHLGGEPLKEGYCISRQRPLIADFVLSTMNENFDNSQWTEITFATVCPTTGSADFDTCLRVYVFIFVCVHRVNDGKM